MRELTDSYCERCGTRYTFGPTPARGPSLAGARLLAKGLKNFVMTDGTSIDEAMAAARIDVTKDESSRVTEEFHRTFNFCMTCRQYACDRCWNENQGACLSCAPLWDKEPVAPRDHLIVRTPVSRQNLDGAVGAQPLAAASGATNPEYAVPWPVEDPLPSRPAPILDGNDRGPAQTTPTVPAEQAAGESPAQPRTPTSPAAPATPAEPRTPAAPPALVESGALVEPPAPAVPTMPLTSAEPMGPADPTATAEPIAPADPIVAAEPIAPAGLPQPQRRPQAARTPSRISEEERAAAQQLQAQSQAWKSRDDGWDLWPLDGGRVEADTLTPDELRLIKAQLSQVPARDDGALSTTGSTPLEADSFTPSHTLDEDAARVVEHEPSFRAEPETPVPAAWEPETPAPSKGPSSDFDLLGSLRQPIELPQPRLEAEQRRAPVIARLLHLPSAAETTRAAGAAAPQPPRQVAVPKSRNTGPTAPWPVATPWVDRPMERHDQWADSTAAPVEPAPPLEALPVETEKPADSVAEVASPSFVASEPIGVAAPACENEPETAPRPLPAADAALEQAPIEPAAAGPESESQPPRAAEAPPESSTDQQTLFTLPPATTNRWAQVQPDIPGRIHVEWPAGDSLDARPAPSSIPAHRLPWEGAPVPAPKAQEHIAWPPIGASWPAQGPAAPWPVSRLLQASLVAAPQAEGVDEESPLVAALWAESAQQVLDRGTVRVCHHCALPVSTQARYCRRCGTEQA